MAVQGVGIAYLKVGDIFGIRIAGPFYTFVGRKENGAYLGRTGDRTEELNFGANDQVWKNLGPRNGMPEFHHVLQDPYRYEYSNLHYM